MTARRLFTVNGLKEWERGLLQAKNGGIDKMKDRMLRTAGLRMLEVIDDNTPVDTGRLKGSMSMGNKDNVFQLEVGRKSFILVGTAVDYAVHVNNGYQQQAGRFVPGTWEGGRFIYNPNAETGMVLTGKVIPGARMFEAGVEALEEDLPDIVEFEFRRLYQELFG